MLLFCFAALLWSKRKSMNNMQTHSPALLSPSAVHVQLMQRGGQIFIQWDASRGILRYCAETNISLWWMAVLSCNEFSVMRLWSPNSERAEMLYRISSWLYIFVYIHIQRCIYLYVRNAASLSTELFRDDAVWARSVWSESLNGCRCRISFKGPFHFIFHFLFHFISFFSPHSSFFGNLKGD